MPLILSLETSTDVCSVAIHDSGKLLAAAEVHVPQSHAARLGELTNQVLHNTSIKSESLDAVAVASGPGSYTGLRIGTSLAKGICFASEIPLITISTLDVLTFRAQKYNLSGSCLCPMIDAMRMEVYCQVLQPDGTPVYPIQAKVIDQQSFGEILEHHSILFFGNGSAKCKGVIDHSNALFIDGIYPHAADLGVTAFDYFKDGKFADLISYEPAYLKEFVAKKSKSLLG